MLTRSQSHAESGFKRFYQLFKSEQAFVLTQLEGITAENDRRTYVSLLLQRLMCLYFLQKRGFLDSNTAYLSTHLERIQEHYGQDQFFRHFLLPLFHSKLSNSRASYAASPLFGNVPLLAFQLFALHPLELRYANIQIADRAFVHLFAFFDTYQWQLKEDQIQAENTLTAAIFAYICEHTSDQKQVGAYYTGTDVSTYITNNTIISYLFKAVQASYPAAFSSDTSIWQLLQRRPERYIQRVIRERTYLPAEASHEYRARQKRYKMLTAILSAGTINHIHAFITYNLDIFQFALDVIEDCEQLDWLLAFYTNIEQISILDPTCGSGAFLMAALHLLKTLYKACLQRMYALIEQHQLPDHSSRLSSNPVSLNRYNSLLQQIQQHHSLDHYILTSIITHNLYGVDLMPEAIEVCKLRLFMALLDHTECIEDIQPLLALQQNIRCGNALVGLIHDPEPAHPQAYQLSPAAEAHENADYGYKKNDRANNQPFHWFSAFPHRMQQGGFDIIIGNPPFVEYHKIKHSYQIQGYEKESCGNLYAAVIERSLALCRSEMSHLGLIVPLSICSGNRFKRLRQIIRQSTSPIWLSNFEIFPSRLFESAFQRLSILLAQRAKTPFRPALYVTGVKRWYAAERPHLINLISYTHVKSKASGSIFPKLASSLHEQIMQKILQKGKEARLESILHTEPTPYFVYYQEATNYWLKATCRVPFYKKNGKIMHPPHGRFLFLANEQLAHTVMALLNCSLFYLWFATYADSFHLSQSLVKSFPTGNALYTIAALPDLAIQLEEEIQRNAQMSTRNTRSGTRQKKPGYLIELEEYRMHSSKALLDEIDRVLASYFGFTNEELDFIINYDIKYRMGKKEYANSTLWPPAGAATLQL
ncbi:hypothetical protein EPA93_47445 [Ktedonosporobacter rubrisoli]|uniref:site-specific DNA-methyltransferase (adenine-specific) n=1 Tax=Ktedonosporobacter rubrisoli TaxID=2509675 RepID=A0A4P6K536_KTERU|nr:DNA methyltransferase [Ktedonosporobacter rubrisoli]QBD83195.1 hypothetical protein EPA93_47445 [Ktedonosporobacter rubrisoli]